MKELLHPSHTARRRGGDGDLREAITQAEVTRVPLCVLTLDFQEIFDRISHQYIFTMLRSYRLSNWFEERIKSIYEKAATSIKINGYVATPIPIQAQLYRDAQ